MKKSEFEILLQTLTNADIQDLYNLMSRKKNSARLYELFLYLNQGLGRKQIKQNIFGQEKGSSLDNLRGQIKDEVAYFYYLNYFEMNSDPIAEVLHNIIIGLNFYSRKDPKIGHRFLESARQKARSTHQFHLHNSIINLQFEYSEHLSKEEFQELVNDHKTNKKLAEEDERATIADKAISRALSQRYEKWDRLNIKGEKSFDQIIRAILEEYDFQTGNTESSPRILYKRMKIIRKYIIANEDYGKFEPYLVNVYQKLAHKFEDPNFFQYKLAFLYMIAHVQFKNKQFNEAYDTSKELIDLVKAPTSTFHKSFYYKAITLHALIKCFQKKLKGAINDLAYVLEDKSNSLTSKEMLNARYDMCFFYLLKSDEESLLKAMDLIENTPTENKALIREMGIEWLVKKFIGTLAIKYELSEKGIQIFEDEAFLEELRSFEKMLSTYTKKTFDKHRKIIVFLGLIKGFIKQKQNFLNDNRYKLFQQYFDSEFQNVNIGEIGFFVWFKAKVEGRDYYPLLLQTIHYKNKSSGQNVINNTISI